MTLSPLPSTTTLKPSSSFFASSKVLSTTLGTVRVLGSGHLYFFSFPPSLLGMSKALIQSFKTALDIGPTVVPPY